MASSSHPRGVFTGPFKSDGGHEVLVAVNTDGQVVAHVVVTTPSYRDRVAASLRMLLEDLDPRGTHQLQVIS